MGVAFWDPTVEIATDDVTIEFAHGHPVATNRRAFTTAVDLAERLAGYASAPIHARVLSISAPGPIRTSCSLAAQLLECEAGKLRWVMKWLTPILGRGAKTITTVSARRFHAGFPLQ